MPIAFVQSVVANSAGGYNNTQQITITPAAGSLLVLNIGTSSAAANEVTGVTDSKSQTWTKIVDQVGGNNKNQAMWYRANAGAGSTVITIQGSGFVAYAVEVQEFSGIATSSALDVTATASDSTYVQVHSVGPTTATTQADALVVQGWAGGDTSNTFTAGSGFSNAAGTNSVGAFISSAMQSKVVSSTGTQSASLSTSSYDWGVSNLAVFKAPAPSAPPSAPTNVEAVGVDTAVSLNWDSMSGATSYEVHRALTSGGTYTKVSGTLVPTANAYTDTGRTNGTEYFYKIKAVNSFGTSGFSSVASAIPQANSADWHPYGTQPNLTVGSMYQTFRDKVDLWFGYTLTTDGTAANSRLPGTVKRIKSPDQGFWPGFALNATVSEGQGYAMLFNAWLSSPTLPSGVYKSAARADFDCLYRYYDYHKNSHGLMNWHIHPNNTPSDFNGATDGDLDAAEGLRAMSAIHGDSGTINYGLEASNLIKAIIDWEFVPANYATVAWRNLMTPGDGWGFGHDIMMVDYMRMGFLRIWEEWMRDRGETYYADRLLVLIEANYDFAEHYVTNWSAGVPDRQKRNYTIYDTGNLGWEKVTYNSVRLGFGWMLDYCWFGPAADSRAKQFMDKIANRFKTVFGTGSNVRAPSYAPDLSTHESYSNISGYAYVGSCSLGLADNAFATQLFNSIAASNEFSTSYFGGGLGCYALGVMSGAAQPFNGPVPTPPDPPLNVTAVAGDATVTVSWSAVSNADDYDIYYAIGAGSFNLLDTDTASPFSHSGLTNGTVYHYKLKAKNADGASVFSAEASATPAAAGAAPAAPTGLHTTASTGSATTYWNASTGATNYKIYRAQVSGQDGDLLSTFNGFQYLDTGLVNGSTYYYKVKATNAFGDSPFSAEVSATPLAIPVAPTGITATAGDAQVTLTWPAVTGSVSYKISRSLTSVNGFSQVATPTALTYTDTGLTNGTTYYYRVESVNANNAGNTSNPAVSATPSATPPVGSVKVWNGSGWVVRILKMWNGTSWIPKILKRWNGSSWS